MARIPTCLVLFGSCLLACGNSSLDADDVEPDAAEPDEADAAVEPEVDGAPDPEPVITTWDLTEDFPGSGNPNGPWTYGYAHNFPGALVEFFALDQPTEPNVAMWFDPDNHDSAVPSAWKNNSADPLYGNPAGGVALHPGVHGESTVARFQAPVAATYTAAVQAFVGDSGPTEVCVVVNDVIVMPWTDTAADPVFSLAPMTLAPGDSIEVWIGPAADGYGDNTPVLFTVTATEEP